MNLVFFKRNGNKDDGKKTKKKQNTHTLAQTAKKRGNLITLVFSFDSYKVEIETKNHFLLHILDAVRAETNRHDIR